MSANYKKLQELARNNDIRFCFVIAPPRSGSTMVEASLSMSPSFTSRIHEPFVHLGYYDEDADSGYRTIYDQTIHDLQSKKQAHILIKEMSHWITPREEYKKIFSLKNSMFLILIRNPLLSIESRIRKILQTVVYRENKDLSAWLESYSTRHQNTFSLFNKYKTIKKSRQEILFDFYATTKGFNSWQSMIEEHLRIKDYRIFNDLIQVKGILPLENSPWEALSQQSALLEKKGTDYMIIDATEYRLAPEDLIKQICLRSKIQFSMNMIHWNISMDDITASQKKAHHKTWYDTLLKSNGIKPPQEEPIALSAFPEHVAAQILQVDIPVYYNLFHKPHRVSIKQNEKYTFLDTIDPIFTATARPELVKNISFRNSHKKFEDIFKVIAAL